MLLFLSAAGRVLHALLDTGGFSLATAQVVDTRAAYFTLADKLDLVDVGGKNGKDSFDAYSVRDFSYGERLAVAAVLALNHYALKLLNTFFLSLTNSYVHVDRVSCLEVRMLTTGFLVFFCDKIQRVAHDYCV